MLSSQLGLFGVVALTSTLLSTSSTPMNASHLRKSHSKRNEIFALSFFVSLDLSWSSWSVYHLQSINQFSILTVERTIHWILCTPVNFVGSFPGPFVCARLVNNVKIICTVSDGARFISRSWNFEKNISTLLTSLASTDISWSFVH